MKKKSKRLDRSLALYVKRVQCRYLDKAMANPGHARLMLNENPIQPSEKVIEAAVEALRHGNWYPDSFLGCEPKSVRCTIWARTMSRCATDLRTPSTP